MPDRALKFLPEEGSIRHKMMLFAALAAVPFLLASVASWPASAERSHNSDRVHQPIRTAVDVISTTSHDDIAHRVKRVLTADLSRSGQFAVIDSANIKAQIGHIDSVPALEEFRAINAEALVVVAVGGSNSGDKINVLFRLWDVASGHHLSSHRFEVASAMIDLIGNCISEAIQQRLSGKTPPGACH